jgi:putative toxin-antitoxin system antitoxin component (TIGR02293 family)
MPLGTRISESWHKMKQGKPFQDPGKPKKPPGQKKGRAKAGGVIEMIAARQRGPSKSPGQVVNSEFDTATGLTAVSDRIHGSAANTVQPQEGPFGIHLTIEGPVVRMHPTALKELRGFTEDEIYHLVVPKRTLARRTAEKQPLTVEETDRAVRLARVGKMAETIFGSFEKAHRWLRKPKPSLEGETPLNYLASETGARVIEEMLTRIDHGILP